jgi:RimK family alpha-L-glutamate ligase
MKKETIGILYTGKSLGKDEKFFLKVAEDKKINLIMINVSQNTDLDFLEEEVKKCGVIYNSSAEEFALEYARTIEEWGKKVIDSPEIYYNTEDKWLFFLKCKKHKLPVPETILLCSNLAFAKKELKKFNKWPVVLKRVYGTMGFYVDKAKTLEEAEKIIKDFWKKGNERIPIIAQEMIHSPSYRVMLIDGKIVQTALKESDGWKATGNYAKSFKKFEVDSELKKLVEKINKIINIKICGIDFLKKDGKWIILEVNSEPDFSFFEDEREKLIGLTLDYLKKSCKN